MARPEESAFEVKPGLGTRPWFRNLVPSILCFPLGVIGAAVARSIVLLRHVHYVRLLDDYPELQLLFSYISPPPLIMAMTAVGGACAVFFVVVSLVGLKRRPWALRLLRSAYVTAYGLLFFYGYVVCSLTSAVEDVAGPKTFDYVGATYVDAVGVFFWRYDYLWPAVMAVALLGILHVNSWRGLVISLFAGGAGEDGRGDVMLENLRSHGRDPRYRKSSWGSVWTHLMIIVIIPWILRVWGCIEPYKPPFGGGKSAVMIMVRKKKPKKKPRKKYVLNMDSAIIFRIPDLDESKIYEEVEEETQHRYVADATAAYGKLGDGNDSTPGWQDGFKDGVVRFIRLEHNGRGWDDGMDTRSRADINFLEKFRQLSGGQKVANHSDHHRVRLLRRYRRTMAPPFVYMTGDSHFSLSGGEIKVLRRFLLNGSLLFGDAGSGQFHGSFVGLCRSLFPESPLRVIADDDPIFQIPFQFPNGAPPLWHHGGTRAMGVKHGGRWVVFYHPGDVNDAWKTGHSGMDPDLAQQAYHLGVNIVYYSFMRYFDATRKYR